MEKDTVIIVAEDDTGHFELIKRDLRLKIPNEILQFRDGEQLLNFFSKRATPPHRSDDKSYVLLLDIRMPRMDGCEALKLIKQDDNLRRIPVIMLTTTDDDIEIDLCYRLGCNFYLVKPVNYDRFLETIENLAAFLSVKQVKLA